MKLRNKTTGKVFNFVIKASQDYADSCFVLKTGSGGWEDGLTYGTLEELHEEWEDYNPKEPLIEDEKVRKAVRAWAEALDASEVSYNSCAEYSEGRFEAEMGAADIDFGRAIGLKDGNYSIAELCGEEEE